MGSLPEQLAALESDSPPCGGVVLASGGAAVTLASHVPLKCTGGGTGPKGVMMPDAPDSFMVLDMQDLPSTDPKRLGKLDRIIVWETEPGVRGVVRLPVEEFTEDTLRAAVRATVEERGKWLRRKLPL